MGTTADKLRRFESNNPSRWRENALNRLANQEERRKARKFAMQILDSLERLGLSGHSLADKLGIKYDDLSPILKGHKMPSSKMEAEIIAIINAH